MALTVGEANGWNNLVEWLIGKSGQQDWALEAGKRLSAGASKRLLAGLGEREFAEEVWPQLLKLRETLAAEDKRELDAVMERRKAEFGVTPQVFYGVAHPEVVTVPIASWSVASFTHDALPEDTELVVRLEGDTQWLRYEDGEPIEVRTA